MLNATVSRARLTLVPLPNRESSFTVACFDRGQTTSFALLGTTLRLLLMQAIEVEGQKVHTVSYRYRLSTDDSKAGWLVRWEFDRAPPREDYEYPLAHVHFNAALKDSEAETRLKKTASHLHAPTARVALELVLWHLIVEWGVRSETQAWKPLLEESLAGFEERRTVR